MQRPLSGEPTQERGIDQAVEAVENWSYPTRMVQGKEGLIQTRPSCFDLAKEGIATSGRNS